MNYPHNIEEKLGFDIIREKIRYRCLSSLGAAFVDKMKFSNAHHEITRWLAQTDEFIRIQQAENNFPSDNYIDATIHFKYLGIEGFFLSEHQLHDIRLSLSTFGQVAKFVKLKGDKYPQLVELFKDVDFDDNIIRKIDRILDKEGNIKPSASHELLDIEASIVEVNRELTRKINSIFKRAQNEGWAAETDITVRDNRIVIPILAEHKRKIPGLVHDESGTGHVYYIEPTEVLDLNNQLREYQIERRREIERILKQVTAEITPEVPVLTGYYQKLGIIDFIRAKASFAGQINAVVPSVHNKTAFVWKKAYHPLLWINHKAQGLDIVPLDVEMNAERRILVISGPNAGGKSVALKTLGLLQYMVQCGVPVPMHEKSEVGLFNEVFIDIGDEQSLDNDLSTYSSHLTNLKHFINLADRKTLFLVDEMGTGTDPQIGGPMAEAILEELNQSKAYGIVTTHFSNLKVLANNTQGMANASMAYDTENLRPLFRLEIGKPGSSFAFEVAQKIGLHKKVLDKAKKKVGTKQKNVDELIVQLEKERNDVNELREKLEQKQLHLDKMMQHYAQLRDEIEVKKKDIIRKAKEDALEIISQSNQVIENTIRTIKETKAEKERTEKARQKVEEKRETLQRAVEEEKVTILPSADFKEGDTVRIKGQFVPGEVISVKGKKAVVAYGDLRTSVELTRLEKISIKEAKKLKEAFKGIDMNEKMTEFNPEIDLRGRRGDEALTEIMTFIDRAIMLGFDRLRIVHGKGDGILRKLLRENLRKLPAIQSIEDEHIEMGGQGVSIVTLK
ncbi:MAG TPA: endonuclease MutS2 [Bacteroidia bacterium]|nr:endonuclease MutS2 [Bacteroidia bacterium]